MSLFQRVEDTRTAWSLLIPHIQPPTDTWLANWVAGHGEPAIERAIVRTSRKFRDGATPEKAHMYTSATLRHIAHDAQEGNTRYDY